MNTELEAFRQKSLAELRADIPALARDASQALKRPAKARIIGSVRSKARFTENSDVDVGIYLKAKAGEKIGPNHDLTMRFQDILCDSPYSFGVLNCIVFLT